MTIAGPVITAASWVYGIATWDERVVPLFFTGLAVTAVGIPVLVSGTRRAYKVKYVLNTHNGAKFAIDTKPGFYTKNCF